MAILISEHDIAKICKSNDPQTIREAINFLDEDVRARSRPPAFLSQR